MKHHCQPFFFPLAVNQTCETKSASQFHFATLASNMLNNLRAHSCQALSERNWLAMWRSTRSLFSIYIQVVKGHLSSTLFEDFAHLTLGFKGLFLTVSKSIDSEVEL